MTIILFKNNSIIFINYSGSKPQQFITECLHYSQSCFWENNKYLTVKDKKSE